MPLDPLFRLSTYLTLALACAALGYAEYPLFPEAGAFAAVVIVALMVIYRLETRVQLLSLADANMLGGGILLVSAVWAGYRVVREYRTGENSMLDWPQFIVALAGPVLMAATAGKLLRREKHAGDYWYLHVAALGAVVLAGAMAEDIPSTVLIAAYAGCAVWSLALFSRGRAGGAIPPVPSATATPRPIPAPGSRPSPGRGRAFTSALLWTAAATAAAVPLYLLTPRSPFGKFDFGRARIEIGYAADQMIDLNKTGKLRENTEPAFEVVATENAGRPKDDLNPLQLWRGRVLTNYQNGSWRRDRDITFPTTPRTDHRTTGWKPPDLGPGRYRLEFTVPTKLRGLFLADPVVWVAGEPAPVADLPDTGPPQPWRAAANGSFGRFTLPGPADRELRYVQYTRPLADPDLGPGYPFIGEVSRVLVNYSVTSVKAYADTVLGQLVRARKLPDKAQDQDQVQLRPAEEYHEAIARAFCEYLSNRPDLVYTTDLRREHPDIDPVEEFLFYTHAGHCERFATALALMLRAEGIPAVVVLGFKGCENTGGGRYVVRQEHAHAWVEALVSRPAVERDIAPIRGVPPAFHDRVWHWLSLDPSPAAEADPTADGAGGLLTWGREAFDRFLVHYSQEERDRALRAVAGVLTNRELLAGIGALTLFGLAVRVVRRRAGATISEQPPAFASWFGQLLKLLAAHGYSPRPGQTPREFAADVAAGLRRRPATAPFAAVPAEWAETYYRERFGSMPVTPGRRAELDAGLDALRRALEDDREGER